MSCHRWEEDLALWVGDDLEAERIPALEEHLASCTECQELYDLLLRSREALQDPSSLEERLAHQGESLRAGVMAQVAEERRRSPWLLLAAALLLALGAFLLWPSVEPSMESVLVERLPAESTSPAPTPQDVAPSRPEPPPEPPSAPTAEPPATAEPSPQPPVAPHQAEPRQAEPRQAEPRQAEPRQAESRQAEPHQAVASIPQPPTTDVWQTEPEPVVVQILTDNPDLVIYWLVDSPAAKEQGHDISTL